MWSLMKVQLELGDGRWEMPNLWKGRKEDSRQGINKRNAATCLFKYSYIKCAWHSPVALPRFEPYPSCSRGNIIILNFSYIVANCEAEYYKQVLVSMRVLLYRVFESVFYFLAWIGFECSPRLIRKTRQLILSHPWFRISDVSTTWRWCIFALDKASIWRKPNVQENKRREKKRKSKENISRRAENTWLNFSP
jgi:hypothetical protein